MNKMAVITSYFKLFITGFLQVLFIGINTIMLSRGYYLGTFIVAFGIGLIWSANVKRIAISTIKERIYYSLGSAIGSVTALLICNIF